MLIHTKYGFWLWYLKIGALDQKEPERLIGEVKKKQITKWHESILKPLAFITSRIDDLVICIMCSNHQSLAEFIHLTVVSRSDLDRKWTSRQWKYHSCFLLAVSVLFINHERSCFTFHVLMVVVKFCYINCLKGEINCKIYMKFLVCFEREREGGVIKA